VDLILFSKLKTNQKILKCFNIFLIFDLVKLLNSLFVVFKLFIGSVGLFVIKVSFRNRPPIPEGAFLGEMENIPITKSLKQAQIQLRPAPQSPQQYSLWTNYTIVRRALHSDPREVNRVYHLHNLCRLCTNRLLTQVKNNEFE
jgi:hypothetical protein